MSSPRILAIDIETLPGVAYVWSLWDKFIPLDRLIHDGRIYSVGMKWVGGAEAYVEAPTERNVKAMLKKVHRNLRRADAVLHYNGEKFDMPWLNGQFVKYGLEPLPPPTQIDLYKVVKRFRLISHKLEYVLPYFGIGAKAEHPGFVMWDGCAKGDEEQRANMRTYCMADTTQLEGLYLFLRPYMNNHPHLGQHGECPNCQSDKLQSRGYRRTRKFRIQRLQCQDCGAWSEGSREKIK